MRNRRLLLLAVLFLALNLASFAQSPLHIHTYQTWMQTVTILGNPYMTDFVGGKAFSAVEESMYVHKLDDGTLEPRSAETTYFYCDRLGRTRAERHVTSYIGKEKSWLASIYIADPVAGFLYRLDPNNHTAMRSAWDLASRRAAVGRDQELIASQSSDATIEAVETQVRKEYLGISQKEGLTVDGWRQTLDVPIGVAGNDRPYEIVVESYISRVLKTAVFVTRDIGTTMRTTRLTRIDLREPDKKLFQVPSSYRVKDAPDPDSLVAGGAAP